MHILSRALYGIIFVLEKNEWLTPSPFLLRGGIDVLVLMLGRPPILFPGQNGG